MELKQKIFALKGEMLETLSKTVQFPTVKGPASEGAPFGTEVKKCLQYVLAKGQEMGFATKDLDGYCGYIEWGNGEEILLIAAHLDVVPVGEGWTYPQFGGVIDKGRMYGRGVEDNKGSAIGALYCLKALKSLGLAPKKKIRIFLGCDEESGMSDIAHYIEKEGYPTAGLVPDMQYPIYNMEKGIMRLNFRYTADAKCKIKELQCTGACNILPDKCIAIIDGKAINFDALEKELNHYSADKPYKLIAEKNENRNVVLTAFGKACHASEPWNGYNAVFSLCIFLRAFMGESAGNAVTFLADYFENTWNGALLGCKCEDVSGPITLNVGIIDLKENVGYNTLDIRYPSTVDGDWVYKAICNKIANEPVKCELVSDSKPLMVPADSPFVVKLQKIYTEITGKPATLKASGGGTYARKLGNRAVPFGAALENAGSHNIHGIDEYIVIDEFMEHNTIYMHVLYDYLFND